jgi:hypothetical protein
MVFGAKRCQIVAKFHPEDNPAEPGLTTTYRQTMVHSFSGADTDRDELAVIDV